MTSAECITIRPDVPNTRIQLSDGSFAEVTILNPPSHTIAHRTAKHEAAHIIVATEQGGIESATIIPGPGYLGATVPVHMTQEAAAAASALGYEGVGHDKNVVEALGGTEGTAEAGALAILSGKEEEHEEVAKVLEEEKTIGPEHVKDAYMRAQNKREGRYDVAITREGSSGEKITIQTQSHSNMITMQEYVCYPVQPEQNQNN